MPAKSISQQQLFGMAIAVRKKEMKRSDVDKEVLDIVNSNMTDKEIEDFARTKHKGLKYYLKENMKDLNELLNESLDSKFVRKCNRLLLNGCGRYAKKAFEQYKNADNLDFDDFLDNMYSILNDLLEIKSSNIDVLKEVKNIIKNSIWLGDDVDDLANAFMIIWHDN